MSPKEPVLQLHNTLTRTKEPFVPLDAADVRMYACGPTVYDFAHIGNGRMVAVFDMLYRLLRHLYGADHMTYVRNITDVDDKINARALHDHPDLPLNDAIRKVTETTAAQFHKDVAALGCLPPDHEPRATEHIGGMIAMIARLIDKGHAYEAGGEVLFRVASMPDYGQLSGRNLEDNLAGARVAVERHKENPADFVLWKRSRETEPGWDSPWGRGRPGWHIECSVMSEALLGETFDIHGGGLDLIFPHHENEIAQSRCAHDGAPMARYWLHNGYVQVEGRKMSKSEGNFITIRDLLETDAFGGRRWPGEVLRLALLMTHYREPIDFSVARLEEAEKKLADWQRVAATATERSGAPDESVIGMLVDDLNFSRAIVAMDVIARKANRGEATAADCLARTLDFLGFPLDSLLRGGADETGIADAITRRLAALAAKDFATADAIRDDLEQAGVQLMDYKDAQSGERRTKWEVKR